MESELTSGTSFTTIRIRLFSVQVQPRSVRGRCFVVGASHSMGGRRQIARYQSSINAGVSPSQGNGCEYSNKVGRPSFLLAAVSRIAAWSHLKIDRKSTRLNS